MLSATLLIDDAEPANINLHDDKKDVPFVFVSFNGLSLYAHDPAAFRRLADSFRDAAYQLDGAIRGRRTAAQVGA